MAQSFSMRYPLIDGQGNFGSVDGDPPAAMRYTEIRLERFAHELLADIDKETVDFGPNYDETETQPLVLPTRVPNLLVNGSSGIAVGMATNIPPHNLSNVVDACLALIDDDSLDLDALMQFIPGPDFPTAGLINGSRGIREAYATGRGKIYMRARVEIEINENTNRQSIIVTELPYQVNKARLLTKIALLVKSKRIEGITGLRDESDKSGMRMVIELRRGEVPEVVINNLYQFTQLESVFGINMVALVNNQPRIFNLRELLNEFLRHRREVVTRRTFFELRKARDRAHLLEGLAVALASIDPIIALIKAAANPAEAKQQLLARDWEPGLVTEMLKRSGAASSRPEDLLEHFGLTVTGYRLSETQTQAILDLRLHRLTGLEQDKIRTEYTEILNHIADLLEILQDSVRLFDVIRTELEAIRERYGDERRTEIVHNRDDLSNEDLIAEEDVVVTLSHAGYAKAQPISEYRAQRRGGRGKIAARTKDEDFVSRLFVANTHDTILCFSSYGKVYWLKVYQLPQAGRISRGRPLVNLLPLAEDEQVTSLLPVRGYEQGGFVVMATADGTIKKTSLADFSRPRTAGIRAIDLNEGNNGGGGGLTAGDSDLLLVSNAGKAIRFNESDLRSMGRTARGVRGLRLKAGQRVISLITVRRDDSDGIQVLLGTENGYGKRTKLDEFAAQKRGGQGVIAIQVKGRNGAVIGAEAVAQEDEIMLITDGGTLIRTRVNEISTQGRNTQGVRLIDLHEEEALVGIGKVEESGSSDDVDE